MKNNLYKGTFNWYGENYTLYTHAKCQSKAFSNFVTQLSKLLERERSAVSVYFVDGSKDNWKITVERRRKDEI